MQGTEIAGHQPTTFVQENMTVHLL